MLKKEDKLILYALTENCRFSNAFIGKIARLNSKTVKKRIQFLEKEGIIEKYYTTTFYSAVGVARYSEVYLETKHNEDSIQEICKIPEIGNIVSYSGKWNLGITLYCTTMEHLNRVVDKIKRILGENLLSLTILNYHKIRFLARDYFLEGVSVEKPKCYSRSSYEKERNIAKNFFPKGLQALDKTDLKIMEVLRENAKIKITEIEKSLGIDRHYLDDKIRRLVEKHIIGYFTARINYSKLGFQKINILMQVSATEEQKEKLISQIKSLQGGYSYAEFVGDWNLMFSIITKNTLQTQREIEEIQKNDCNIIKKLTVVTVANEYKHSSYPENLSEFYKYCVGIFTGGGQLLSHKNLAYYSWSQKDQLSLGKVFRELDMDLTSAQQIA